MAPKKKPYNQLRKSAKNYRDNAAARAHKNAANRKINKRIALIWAARCCDTDIPVLATE